MILESLLVIASAVGGPARHEGPLAKVLEEARAKGRPVILDFTLEGAPPCKWMDEKVLADDAVVAACGEGFIVYRLRLSAKAGEGIDLWKKHRVGNVPAFLFLDPAGEEIDRIEGTENRDDFLHVLKDVRAGDHMKGLAAKVAKDPKDAAARGRLGVRLAMRGEDAAWDHLETAVQLDPKDALPSTIEARWFLAKLGLERDYDQASVAAFAKKYPDHPRAVDAHRTLLDLARDQNDEETQEASLEFLLKRAPDASVRNSLSWLLAIRGRDLPRALALVEEALKEEPGEPAFLDTRAECLSRLGRHEEAVAEQKKAIENLPASTPAKRRAEYEKRLQEFTKKRDEAKK